MKKSAFLFWSAIILILTIFLFPLLNVVLLAFKSDLDIMSLPPKLIFSPTLDHFSNVLVTGGYSFDKYFINSFYIAILSTFLVLVLTFFSAYSVARYRVGSKKLPGGILSLRFFPPILFCVPFYMIFSFIGLRDTIVGIAIAHTLINLPIAFLIMLSFIEEIPRSVEEAAIIDGCSTGGLLRNIVLPLLRPGLIAVGFISFIFSWNEYLLALVLCSTEATTVTVGAGLFVQSFGVKYGEIAAVTVLALIPPLLIAILFRKSILKGLTMGTLR